MCDHSHESCSHSATRTGLEQTLDEIEFEKSIFNMCVYGDLEKVKHEINKDRSIINKQDRNGYSCLHYAARNNHYELCKYLIQQGVDVNLKTRSGESTALHRAACVGACRIVQLLIESKSDPFLKDSDGKTALHKCSEELENAFKNNSKKLSDFINTAKVLIKFNPDLINQTDKKGKSSIDYCIKLNDLCK